MKKYIFISIPRNASHTICKILNQSKRDRSTSQDIGICDNHASSKILYKRYGEKEFINRFRFCFVRNPWARCVSWYMYHKHKYPYNKYNFESWIRAKMPHHWTMQNGTNYSKQSPLEQHIFITDKNGNININFVGKIENFNEDMNKILEKLGANYINTNVKLNKSNHKEYKNYYNEDTKNIVANLLKRDIELFKYEF